MRETNHAIFNYSENDSNLINELSNYLTDDNINKIYNFFDKNLEKEKPIINIYETKEEFDNVYKKIYDLKSDYDVPNWLVGFADPITMQIYYLSLNDYKNTSHAFKEEDYAEKLDYFKKTILHEYVHFVHYLFCIKYKCDLPSKYLTEGIAQYLSRQVDDNKLSFNYRLDEIIGSNDNYKAFYILTKYLIDNYSHEFVLELIKAKENSVKYLMEVLFDEVKNYYNEEKNKMK